MNAAVRWFLVVVLLFAGLFFVVPWTLPGEWRAEAERLVPARPGAVAALVGDLHRWPEWSPWVATGDRTAAWEVQGSGREPGDVLEWRARGDAGPGRLRLTAGGPAAGFVEYEVTLGEDWIRSRGRLAWEEAPGGTRVRWTDGGPVRGPAVYRWFAGALSRAVEQEQGRALDRLAALAAAAGEEPGSG